MVRVLSLTKCLSLRRRLLGTLSAVATHLLLSRAAVDTLSFLVYTQHPALLAAFQMYEASRFSRLGVVWRV